MLTYRISGKNLVPVLTRAREACRVRGEITSTPLSPHGGITLHAHVRYPPDPDQFRQFSSYTPSLQPHSFSITFDLCQISERTAALNIHFLYGHDRPEIPSSNPEQKNLEQTVAVTSAEQQLLYERNGYTPYLKFISRCLAEEWKNAVPDATLVEII